MNNLKNKLVQEISNDKFESEIYLCNAIKHNIFSVIDDYFFIDEKSVKFVLQKTKVGKIKMIFQCEIEDVCKSNF